jgi:hypothetical protein
MLNFVVCQNQYCYAECLYATCHGIAYSVNCNLSRPLALKESLGTFSDFMFLSRDIDTMTISKRMLCITTLTQMTLYAECCLSYFVMNTVMLGVIILSAMAPLNL